MKRSRPLKHLAWPLLAGMLVITSFDPFVPPADSSGTPVSLPYKAAGLTKRQAAAHLLSRLSFGATPGQVDAVLAMGLEKWVTQQLNGNLPDDSLARLLREYDALTLTNEEIVKNFPRRPNVLRAAIREGVVDKDSVNKADKQQYVEQLAAYAKEKGYRPEKELFRQFFDQKVLRAAFSQNQLQEVLTDFWFNHFNVSMTKRQCAPFIPNYERDAIRPHTTGKFADLLLATAQSPAMLIFLDNFSSTATNPKFGRGGLNENYAREVMELHTLGVDGGYTQDDVTQAACVLTGWMVYPIDQNGAAGVLRSRVAKLGEERLAAEGFVHKGDFLFAPRRHDKTEKTVLGKKFPAGGGYEEGVELLNMLAHHPATAKFISRKLAIRFVSDDPPQSLVDKMAKTFLKKDGNIKEVLKVMIGAPEFWSQEALRQKTKSPFELAISSVRALNASIERPYKLYNWIDKMGQKLYNYQAPTGFPDKGSYWINTGSLLSRMNFGLALAAGRIPGVRMDLMALNHHHEPESVGTALETYCRLVMPERDLKQTIERLTPLLSDPALERKLQAAAGQQAPSSEKPAVASVQRAVLKGSNAGRDKLLAQVVGIVIGSPEFQRR